MTPRLWRRGSADIKLNRVQAPTGSRQVLSMRKFIRHPSCIPIDIAVDEAAKVDGSAATAVNVSSGGLAFSLLHPVNIGSRLTISMPQVWPDYSACGTVVWCREAQQGFEAGVQFDQPDEAFKARMVAQFCQIEDYRREMRETEGRSMSSEEAAREWILRYAEEFADTIGYH